MLEKDIQNLIRIEVSKLGARVFRNNVGLFETLDGRAVKTGLCKGSSDLIGWTKKGRFLAIEVKTKKGKTKENQINFINEVNKSGGVGFIARSPEEAVNKLLNATREEWWIKCADRLPELKAKIPYIERVNFLVITDKGFCCVLAFYSNGNWENCILGNPTYWQPLPKPPKAKE